jgi:hypothetical protein
MVDLSELVAISKNIKGNTEYTGAHYLLGYVWANLSDEKQNEIYEIFKEKETN